MKCPEVHLLRAFAEPEGVSGLVEDAPAFASHVQQCARCRGIVENAREEEKTLRSLEPGRPQGSARALERTLSRLDRGPTRRGPRVPGTVLALVASLSTVGFVLVLAHTPESHAPVEERPAETPTVTPSPRPPALPPRETPNPPEKTPADTPGETAPVPSETAPEPIPAEPPTVPDEKPPVVTQDPEKPGTQAKALAFARSGKLSTRGRTLAANEALPETLSITVGSVVAEIETVGSASIVLAPRSTFSIRPDEKGDPELSLASGKLLATSHGGHYAVVTRDGRATPCGTVFVVAVESAGTRVATLEGEVDLAPASGPVDRVARIRAGFEARAVKGKTDLPRPSAEKLDWLPAARRPRPPRPPALVLELALDRDSGKFAHLTQGALEGSVARAARRDNGTAIVQLTGPRLLELAPEVWFEATVKTDTATSVDLMIWDDDVKENFACERPVEPGRWVTVAAPLSSFVDKGKLSRTIAAGHTTHEVNVYTGAGDLVLERVRFFK